MTLVPVQQHEDAAARAAGGDALEPRSRHFAEARREIGYDQEMVFLGNAPGLLVVFGDRRILIAQIHLDHFFDVLAEFGEALFDLLALGPDAPVDEALLVIGELHQSREVLAEPNGIEDREADLSRRRRGEKTEYDLVDGAYDRSASGLACLKKKRTLTGKRECQGSAELRAARQSEARVFGNATRTRSKIRGEPGELRGRRKMGGRRPLLGELR